MVGSDQTPRTPGLRVHDFGFEETSMISTCCQWLAGELPLEAWYNVTWWQSASVATIAGMSPVSNLSVPTVLPEHSEFSASFLKNLGVVIRSTPPRFCNRHKSHTSPILIRYARYIQPWRKPYQAALSIPVTPNRSPPELTSDVFTRCASSAWRRASCSGGGFIGSMF